MKIVLHIELKDLKGNAPSEKAGITIKGDNKWLTLMRTAIKHKNAQEKTIFE